MSLVEARNQSIWFYTKFYVKQTLFFTSFSASQQTSMAKLPVFLKRSQNEVHALRVNVLRVFLYRADQVI